MTDLEASYRATTYRADTPDGPLSIRVGERCGPLDDLLRDRGFDCWVFVTAHNPGSRRLDPAENACRHANLVAATAGHETFDGESIADAGDWPPEWSLLVLGIDKAAALALGRRLGQNAVLLARRDESARLAWCRESDDVD